MTASPMRWTTNIRRGFIAASILWAALLVAAPFAVTRSSPGAVWYAVAFAVYGIGQWICHQLPERSFYLWTAQLPVCARCTGVYAGGALAALVAATRTVRPPAETDSRRPKSSRAASRGRHDRPRRKRRRQPTGILDAIDLLGSDARLARWVLTVAALPTAVTLVYEWTTGSRPSNLIRALSGLPLGAAIVLIVASALAVAFPPAAAPEPAAAARKVN